MSVRLLAFLFILLCWVLPVRASVDASVTWADTLYVVGARTAPERFDGGAVTVTVLDLEDGEGGDLAALLAEAAGLQVRRYGGLGAPVVPAIRGAGGGQVRILVDGVPLANAFAGAVDLSLLSLDAYSAAEIYRGASPARFGGAGGAGAVNLVSRRGWAADVLQLSTGSFGEAGVRWERGWSGGALDLGLLLHARRIDNRYGFENDNQTHRDASDDFADDRANAGFDDQGARLHGAWYGDALTARWRLGTYRREAGRPGPTGSWSSPEASLLDRRHELHLDLQDAAERLAFDVSLSRADERLSDPENQVGWPAGDSESRSDQAYARLGWTGGREGPGWRVGWNLGLDGRREWYDLIDPLGADPQRRRTATTATGLLELHAAGPRLTLVPQWRWRRLSDDFAGVPPLPHLPETPAEHVYERGTPALGVAWDAVPGRLVVEAHAARSLREPSWVELFGQRGGVVGNRALRPETVDARDLALRLLPAPGVRLRLAWFRNAIDDAIVWRATSWTTGQAFNIGGAEIEGTELEFALGSPGGARLAGNLTVQNTRDAGDDPIYAGRDLPYLPEVESFLELGLPTGRWRLGLRWIHRGSAPRDRYNDPLDRMPAHSLWHASLGRTFRDAVPGGHDLALRLELLNLTDTAVDEIDGYPLPGRSFRVVLGLH